jgi:hypothetical protein
MKSYRSRASKQRRPVMGAVRSVNYNDGDKPDNFALVVGEKDGEKLDLLWYAPLKSWNLQENVEHLEPENYGDTNGGVTWSERS